MFAGVDTRRVWESYQNGTTETENGTGAVAFLKDYRKLLGLRKTSRGVLRRFDTLESGEPAYEPQASSLRDLAEGIVGQDFVESMNPVPHDDAFEGLEAGEGAVNPGNFPNTSLYYSAITGMLEAQVLMAYDKPEYIADRVAPAQQTSLRSNKLVGIGRLGDQAKIINPGEDHPLLNMTERWVTTPDTVKRGSGIAVTKEAIFFDYTGQILERASTVGDELALNKEKRVLRMLCGLDNPYNYNGTSYNTYLTSGNWINTQSSLPLTDWTALEAARLLFSRMTDQETSERITIRPDTLIVSDGRETAAEQVLNATQLEIRTQSAAQNRWNNNQERGRYTLISSPILEQVLVDSGVSASNALEYWFLMNAGKAFVYMQNWAVQRQTVTADSWTMASKGLVFAVFCNEMGACAVREPRATFKGYSA